MYEEKHRNERKSIINGGRNILQTKTGNSKGKEQNRRKRAKEKEVGVAARENSKSNHKKCSRIGNKNFLMYFDKAFHVCSGE